MSPERQALAPPDAGPSYEEAVAEMLRAEERGARAFMLDLWRAHQAREAAREAEKAPAGDLPVVASFW